MKKRISTLLVFASITAFSSQAAASSYTVKNGDTMGEIASNQDVSLEKLVANNPAVSNPDFIHIGQKINVDTKSYKKVNTKKESGDVDLLARLIHAEAVGESYAGKLAVANVVLNRTKNKEFPDTIRGVIYESGQFSPVSNGMINNPADNDSIRAAKEAISIGGNPGGNLYFFNPATADSQWVGTQQVTETIGNHVFAK